MRGTYQTPLDFFADRRSHPGRIRKTHGIARFRYSLCGRFCTGYRRLAVRDECHAGLYVEIRDRKKRTLDRTSADPYPGPGRRTTKKRSRTLNRKLIGKYGRITGKDFSPVCADGSIKKEEAEALLEKKSLHSNWKFSVSSGKRPWNIRRNCST